MNSIVKIKARIRELDEAIEKENQLRAEVRKECNQMQDELYALEHKKPAELTRSDRARMAVLRSEIAANRELLFPSQGLGWLIRERRELQEQLAELQTVERPIRTQAKREETAEFANTPSHNESDPEEGEK